MKELKGFKSITSTKKYKTKKFSKNLFNKISMGFENISKSVQENVKKKKKNLI